MTFSLVARDARRREWGVAVASKFLAVGSVVPWARAEVGAVATQSYANPTYGPRGLDLMARGLSARDALDRLLAQDEGRAQRQVGLVDADAGSATFTGDACHAWAGGRKGRGYAAQGNILAGPQVVDAMAETFESTEGDLAQRLLAALLAGDRAGGDRRGRQSAALLVVKEKGGYGAAEHGWARSASEGEDEPEGLVWVFDRMIDLRVDDHPDPVPRLAEMLDLWRLYFTRPTGPGLPVEGRVRAEVSRTLRKLGHLAPKEPLTPESLTRFLHQENFEERVLPGFRIDPDVLAWIRKQGRGGGD